MERRAAGALCQVACTAHPARAAIARTFLTLGSSGCLSELWLTQSGGSRFFSTSAFALAAPPSSLFWSTLFGSSFATCRYMHDCGCGQVGIEEQGKQPA